LKNLKTILWVNVLDTTKTTKVVHNLNVGQIFEFRVRALNRYQIPEPSVMKNSIIAFYASEVMIVDDRGLFRLQWLPLNRNNGNRVRDYFIEQRVTKAIGFM